MPEWTAVPLDAVRAIFAARLLPADDAPAHLGSVTLWPHQRDAVSRLRAAIAEFRGALLADDVGLGKTFVALAVASRYARPLVVAPAALRAVWRDASARAAVEVTVISMEQLSRGPVAAPDADFVIVDEAHHARNPATKRHAALARLVAGADTLLLSATPVHNSRDDLAALLALFLGARARALDGGALARCVVRRSRSNLERGPILPRVDGPHSILVDGGDDGLAESILALPPPLPAADGGSADALVLVTMIRQWSSSVAALRGGIRRRLAVAHALDESLAAGRHPTRRELAAWTLGDDAQQLALPELLAPPRRDDQRSLSALRETVARHRRALEELVRRIGAHTEVDGRRARALLDAWRAHPGERLLAFSQFAATVDAYWRELRGVPRVCALTAAGGRIAGGAVGRAEVLASFAPRAAAIPAQRRIDALVATDLASEGLDLQSASVLAHLDLPWTAARLEQRLGRVRRPGAASPVIHLYAIEPPARAAALIAIRERLAAKLAAARLTLGDVMPDLGIAVPPDAGAGPALTESVRARLARWRRASRDEVVQESAQVMVAGSPVAAGQAGWIALLADGEHAFLAASIGGRTGDELAILDAALALLGEEIVPDRAAVEATLAAVLDWRDAQHGARLAGAAEVGAWEARRRTLADVAGVAHAPRSRRAETAVALHRARAVATGALGLAEERRLAALRASSTPSSAIWLDAVARLVDRRPREERWRAPERPRLIALIVLAER
ncbi:MAG TPA: DEAD/DEAH box helicase [Gemmatimonadaceae bacterium]